MMGDDKATCLCRRLSGLLHVMLSGVVCTVVVDYYMVASGVVASIGCMCRLRQLRWLFGYMVVSIRFMILRLRQTWVRCRL